MILFDINVLKAINARSGFSLWRLKELLVSTGQWTVIGSGDGSTYFAYNGVTGALAPGNQGSGGSFDALKTGTGLGTLVASDWSTGGWCVLRDDVGREVLFVDSTSTPDSGWNSYGRMAYSRSSGFVGTSVSATTIPAAAADEQWVFGSRGVPAGVEMFDYGTLGYLHFYAHDTATNGVAGFGWASASSVGAMSVALSFSATEQADSNSDSLVIVVGGTGARAWASPTTSYAYWDTSCAIAHPVGTLPAEPQGGGKECLHPFYVYSGFGSDTAITSADCGYPIDVRSLRFNGTARQHPDVLDCGSTAWLFIAGNTCIPWPSTATVPLSGTSVIRNGTEYLPTFTNGNMVVPVNQELVPVSYYQRVWDTINLQWCYFTKGVIDPSPSTTDTSPVNSGSISGHSVLRTKVG